MKRIRGTKLLNSKWCSSVLVVCLILSGCTDTKYIEYNAEKPEEMSPFKTVAYEIDKSFYENFPRCVLIIPPASGGKITTELSNIIEVTLARHLQRRFNRVIDGIERKVATERHELLIGDPIDQQFLARKMKCDSILNVEVLEPRIDYVLIWSRIGIGLKLQLARTEDGHVLWQAKHKAERSEGGLSLSPLGAVVDTVTSTRFASDRDVAEGVIDDAVRRMIVPLPNVRSF
jgi:hypothetical protein